MSNLNKTIKSPSVPAFIGIDLAKHSVHVWGVLTKPAITAAMQRSDRRYVGIKREARPSQQALHRMRSLAEFGLEISQGRHNVRQALPQILGDGGAGEISLEPLFVDGLTGLYDQLVRAWMTG